MITGVADQLQQWRGTQSSAGSGRRTAPPADMSTAEGASTKVVLTKLLPVMISLDRRVGTLEDRSAFVVVIKDAKWKEDVQDLRKMWRELEAKRREGKQPGDTLGPHPLGGSQRSVVFKLLIELLHPKSQSPQKEVLQELQATTLGNIDNVIFRGKPRHEEPHREKPWVWAFIFCGDSSSYREVSDFHLVSTQMLRSLRRPTPQPGWAAHQVAFHVAEVSKKQWRRRRWRRRRAPHGQQPQETCAENRRN